MEAQRGSEWKRTEHHHAGCHVNTYGQLTPVKPTGQHQHGNALTMPFDGQFPDSPTMLGRKGKASKLGRSGETMHIHVFGGQEQSARSSYASCLRDSVHMASAHDVYGAHDDDVTASVGLWAPSNSPMTSMELHSGTMDPPVPSQTFSPRSSVSPCMEPSICLDGVPCLSSLAGFPELRETCSSGLATPHATPRNSVDLLGNTSPADDSDAPNSLCEDPLTPRSEEAGTPRGLYSDAIRRLEEVYISGENRRSSVDPFEALTPRRRGLAAMLRPGSGSSTPRSHSEKKRVSQLLKQNKPSMLRSFLCPRVQTGSAAYSEAAVQADESVSSRSLSQGTADSVAGSSRDDNVSTIDESPTSRLHYQQVMQSTVMHDCAAFDLQATPREGPGPLGKSSRYVLAWTALTGFFLREVDPGLDTGGDQALKILQEHDIQTLADTVQTVPVNAVSPGSPLGSCTPKGTSVACSGEAWNAFAGSECCSPPRIGSVAASYDSTHMDPPGADQHLKGLSALRTLAAKTLAREPAESITIGDWIIEAVESEGLEGEHKAEKLLATVEEDEQPEESLFATAKEREQPEERLLVLVNEGEEDEDESVLVPVNKGEEPEDEHLVTVKEWELKDERLLVPVKEGEQPEASMELSVRRLVEQEAARRTSEETEALEESDSLCEMLDAEPLLGSWKDEEVNGPEHRILVGPEERMLDELSRTTSPLKGSRLLASVPNSDCSGAREVDWHAADREAVEALITATDKRSSAAATSTVSLSSLVSASQELMAPGGSRGSCTALAVPEGKGPRKGKKGGGSKGKASRKGAVSPVSVRAAKPEGYANNQMSSMLRVPPAQRAKNTKPRRTTGSSFGAWSAESSFNTSMASIPASPRAAKATRAKASIVAPPPKKPAKTNKKSPGRVSPRGTPAQQSYVSMLRASSPRHPLASSSELVLHDAEEPVAQLGGQEDADLDYDNIPPGLPDGRPMDVGTIEWMSTSSPRKRGRTNSKSNSLAASMEVNRCPKSRLAATEAGESFRVPCLMLNGQMGMASLDAESAADVNAQIEALSIDASGQRGEYLDDTADEEPVSTVLIPRPSEGVASSRDQRIVNLIDLDMDLPSTPSVSPELKPLDTSAPGIIPTCSLSDAADFDVLDGLVPERVASPSLSHTSDEDKTKLVARWWLKRSTSRARSSSGLGLIPKSLHCPSPLRDGSSSPQLSYGCEDLALIKLDSPDHEDEESWLMGNSPQNAISPAARKADEEEPIQFISDTISIVSNEEDTFW